MKGRLEITRFVAADRDNPARMYGLYPARALSLSARTRISSSGIRNGIWRIQNESLHHAVDYTPYEGMELLGFPNIVISRARSWSMADSPLRWPEGAIFWNAPSPTPLGARGKSGPQRKTVPSFLWGPLDNPDRRRVPT